MIRSVISCAVVVSLVVLCGCQQGEASKAMATDKPAAAAPAQAPAAGQPAQKPADPRQWVEASDGKWLVHDMNRPTPPVITPGEQCGQAPSDAVVLFDGTEGAIAANWTDTRGNPTKWKAGDGYMESVKGAGYIQSKAQFGSCQLHVEFATPSKVEGDSQGRGNSGVFLQGQYEVQVLDSFDNRTYADGQCSALYGRAVPLVNVCRKPGEWQSYDIIYHRPHFGPDAKVTRKATFTILQNGVVVQDHVTLEGGTGWINANRVTEYAPHGDKGPIQLQDHGNPVRYRNVWVRELKD